MNEHGYIKAIKRHLHKECYQWKIADPYCGGVPDFFLEGYDHDLWVEFKYLRAFPKRESTLIDLTHTKYLSKLQQQWLTRRTEKRGDCCVIVGSEHGGYLFTGLTWQQPIAAGELRIGSLPNKTLAQTMLDLTKCRQGDGR